MKALIKNVLRQECEKHVLRHFDYLRELHDYAERKTKRENKPFNKTIHKPEWWELAPQFNPFKMRLKKRINTYAFTLAERIRRKAYKPKPPLLYPIRKEDGSIRPLNIFQLPDAAISNLVYKSLLQKNSARFSSYAYAYREDRTPHHAVTDVFSEWQELDRVYVAEYDFSRFFDEISHDYLWGVLDQRIFAMSDYERHIIKEFLSIGASEKKDYPTVANPRTRGIPQGTSISLFLANVACWELDKDLERLGVGFARYADDTLVWGDDYSKIVRSYYLIDENATRMGVPINLVKSHGISLLSRVPKPQEIATKKSVNYLGYEISLEHISIAEKKVAKIKSRMSYLLYQNLLQPLNIGIYNSARLSGGVDEDYATALRQLRYYLYGGLADEKLREYVRGRVRELNFRGLMSYYPIVTNVGQLAKLDGWLIHTIRQALRARQKRWISHSATTLPGPSPDWIEKIERLGPVLLPSKRTVDLTIPSFTLINSALRIAISRKGITAVANPATAYYP